MSEIPETAMVFAAGLGTRMRAFRSDVPKPLVPVAGRTLLDRVLDKLVAVGVKRAVINVSYLGEMVEAHLAGRRDIEMRFSREEKPLETGGGIVRALPYLGEKPFFAVNADIAWVDGHTPLLQRLADAYEPERMDALLTACPIKMTTGYDGDGDFVLDSQGRVRRKDAKEVAPYVFGGIQVIHPRIFDEYRGMKETPVFSLNRFFQSSGDSPWFERIFAISHDALWMHVGDGEGVRAAEAALENTD